MTVEVVITAIFVAAGATYIGLEREEFTRLDWPSAFPVVVVAIGFVLGVALRSMYNFLVARRLGASLGAAESFMLSLVVAAGNFVMPAGVGVGLRAFYMKRVHDFPVAYFAGGMLVFVIGNIVVVSVLALLLLAAGYHLTGSFRIDLAAALVVIIAGISVGVLIVRSGTGITRRLQPTGFGRLSKGLELIANDCRLGGVLLLICMVNFAIASLTWIVALRDVAPSTDFVEAFLLSASQIIAGFVNLTPGAAGFQELAALYVGRTFAATAVELFAVLLWVRAVRMLAAFLLSIPAVVLLRRGVRRRGAARRGSNTKQSGSLESMN